MAGWAGGRAGGGNHCGRQCRRCADLQYRGVAGLFLNADWSLILSGLAAMPSTHPPIPLISISQSSFTLFGRTWPALSLDRTSCPGSCFAA